MPTYADGEIPDAAALNAVAAGSVEVYQTTADRNAALPAVEEGQLAWIIDESALELYTADGWVELATVRDRGVVVKHPLRTPPSADPWKLTAADLSAAYQARSAGLAGIGGAASRSPLPLPDGANYSALTAEGIIRWAGTDAAGLIDDAREIAHYPMGEVGYEDAQGAAVSTAENLGGVSYQPDGEWITLILVGVASWRVHLTTTARIVAVGAGGYGGAGSEIHLHGYHETSPVGGGGGGGGAVSEAVVELSPGQVLTARTGSRINRSLNGEEITPRLLGGEYGGDVAARDGIAVDVAGGSTAAWIDGRAVVRAGGGSRGGTHPEGALGGEPSPSAFFVSGGSQGGGCGLLPPPSVYPPPPLIAAGRSSRGAVGGLTVSTSETRLLLSGGGGGGAAAEGEAGTALGYTNRLGAYALGGAGGAGIDYGWAGIPPLGAGGAGGWAAGYPAAIAVPTENGATYGAGGAGGQYYASTNFSGSAGGTHLTSAHRPGLGAVLIRYRADG